MTATERLHELGQSIWLDNITREMLDSGQLRAYIDDYSVTGLTSNPSIFDKAIAAAGYDDAIREKGARGTRPEALFFELAIEDLRRAADAFLPIHERTAGLDGWVSLEVSPLLAHDPGTTVEVAKELYDQAARPNLLIKIPGTKEGLLAVEEAIAAGIPWARSPRSSCRAGTSPCGIRCRHTGGTGSPLRSGSRSTAPTASSWTPIAGGACRTPAPACSGSCGRARARRIRRRRTTCTCSAWAHRSP
jgi:hypothetical protein